MLTKMYFEVSMVALAYASTQRSPRDLGAFDDFEKKVAYRKYVLARTYNGTEARCYDELRLTKRTYNGTETRCYGLDMWRYVTHNFTMHSFAT